MISSSAMRISAVGGMVLLLALACTDVAHAAAMTPPEVAGGPALAREAPSYSAPGAGSDVHGASRAANVGVAIDPVAITKLIKSAAHSARDRSGFVKGVMESVAFGVRGKPYNVMVFNLSQNYARRLHGLKYYRNVKYGSITYGVFVFRSGTFTNKGDGGWINWAFSGRFDRTGKDGKHVVFK